MKGHLPNGIQTLCTTLNPSRSTEFMCEYAIPFGNRHRSTSYLLWLYYDSIHLSLHPSIYRYTHLLLLVHPFLHLQKISANHATSWTKSHPAGIALVKIAATHSARRAPEPLGHCAPFLALADVAEQKSSETEATVQRVTPMAKLDICRFP